MVVLYPKLPQPSRGLMRSGVSGHLEAAYGHA